MHPKPSQRERVSLPAVLKQFHLYLAQQSPTSPNPGQRCGQALARLISHNPRAVRAFKDHAEVARHLLASGEVDTLFRVAASGLLHGPALQFYRLAIESWLSR